MFVVFVLLDLTLGEAKRLWDFKSLNLETVLWVLINGQNRGRFIRNSFLKLRYSYGKLADDIHLGFSSSKKCV